MEIGVLAGFFLVGRLAIFVIRGVEDVPVEERDGVREEIGLTFRPGRRLLQKFLALIPPLYL